MSPKKNLFFDQEKGGTPSKPPGSEDTEYLRCPLCDFYDSIIFYECSAKNLLEHLSKCHNLSGWRAQMLIQGSSNFKEKAIEDIVKMERKIGSVALWAAIEKQRREKMILERPRWVIPYLYDTFKHQYFSTHVELPAQPGPKQEVQSVQPSAQQDQPGLVR